MTAPVASPCVSICTMDDASGLCIGCLRTIDEIAAWGGMSDGERRSVLARLPARRAFVPAFTHVLEGGPHRGER